MRKIFLLFLVLFVTLSPGVSALAAKPLRVYVREFSVTGAPNKDDLKSSLQMVLASRLASDSVDVTDAPQMADVTISGTYLTIGKVFSLDLVAKDKAGVVLARAFEQGESSDDLIPAVGKLARKVSDELVKKVTASPAAAPAPQPQVQAAGSALPAAPVVKPTEQPGDIIRQTPPVAAGLDRSSLQKIEGEMSSLVAGEVREGGRLLVVASGATIRLYNQEKGLALLDEVTLKGNEKVLAVDSVNLDSPKGVEIYVTITRGNDLASQVFTLANNKFKKIAGELDYFFRAIDDNGNKKIRAQGISPDEDYYGAVYDVTLSGTEVKLSNPYKLPRFGTIFNHARFTDKEGKKLVVVLHKGGNLIVYSEAGEELWRSSDNYGGSEAYFTRNDIQNMRVTGSETRKVFIDQRVTTRPDGTILVPQNGGLWDVGDSRSYSKSAIYAFSWNGASLDELWHTKQSQTYIADYTYDDKRKEVVTLEVAKRAGILSKGSSVVVVRKVE